MPDTVDELQIKINAEATKANNAIDRLVGKLDRLTTSLSRVNGTNLNGLANGVQRLGNAMQVMNTIKTADFTRLATNLTRLGTVNVSALNSAASSMSHLTRAFNSLGTVSANAQAVGEMAKNIAKLGNKSVQTAITNIPQLAIALNNLMTTLSKSPKVSQNVVQMTNAIANLANQGSKVGSASNSIARELNKTTTATKKASSGFKGLASYIGKFYATYFMAIRGIKKLWSSIESTADYIEAYNYFNVSLGKIGSDWSHQWEKYGYDSAESYAESFKTRLSDSLKKLSGVQVSIGADGKGLLTESEMKNLGLNIQEITQYASQLASVTNSVGQTGEVSIATASAFTKLAGDISSLFNVDYSSVSKNLQSGLIGQSRALYKYGIDITNATLQAYAYNLGLSKSVSEMTQAEKMQLRMLAILDQSKVSWGDLANTINSPSNMIRQFKNNLKETGMVLGQLFIPVLQKVLPIVNGTSIAFKRLLTDIAGFLNINIDLDSFGQGYTDMEDNVDGITDSYEDATKAAKEWKNQLLGFDEINKLTEDTSADTSGLDNNSIDLTDSILAASSEYEKVWNKAYEQMENSALKIANKIEKAFEPIKNIGKYILKGEMYEAGSSLAELINDGIEKYDWGNVGTYIGKRITGTFDFVAGFAGKLDWVKMAKSITTFLNSAISEIDPESVADAINALLNGILDFTTTLLTTFDFGQLVKTVASVFKNLDWGAVINIMSTIIASKWIGKAFTAGYSAIKNTIGNAFSYVFSTGLTGASLGIAGGLGAILISIFSVAMNQATKEGEAAERRRQKLAEMMIPTKEVQEKADEINAITEGLVSDTNSRLQQVEDIDISYDAISKMADEYFKLADKQNKSNEELAKMQGLHDLLIEKYPGFKDILDDEKLSYKEQREEIDKLIKKMKTKAKAQAGENLLVKAYESQAAAQKNLTKANEEWAKSQEPLQKLKEDYWKAKSRYKQQLEDDSGELLFDGKSIFDLKREMDAAEEAYSRAAANTTELHIALTDAQKAYDDICDEIELYSDMYTESIIEMSDATEEATDNMVDSYSEVPESVEKTANDTNAELGKTSQAAQDGAKNTVDAITSEYDKLPGEVKKVIADTEKEINNGTKSGKYTNSFGNITRDAEKGLQGMPSSVQQIMSKGVLGNVNKYTASGTYDKWFSRVTQDGKKGLQGMPSSVQQIMSKGVLENVNKYTAPGTYEKWFSRVTEDGKKGLQGMPSSVQQIMAGVQGVLEDATDEAGKEGKNFGVEWAKQMWKGMETGGIPTSVLNQMKNSGAYADKFNSSIPKLANGAVLKANRPFLALVGDQKNGTNIEAPLDTIKQGLSEVLGNYDSVQIARVSQIDYGYNSSYPSSSRANQAGFNSEEIELARQQVQLLQMLIQKNNAVAIVSPDADGIFKIVQNKANSYTTQTGKPAFLV